MKKKIICPECDGRGYISHVETWSDGNGVGGGKAWSEPCANCNGAGEVEVPMTNYDFIKSLTIEDMADLLDSFGACSRCRNNGNNCFPVFNTEEWLNQEYKGD